MIEHNEDFNVITYSYSGVRINMKKPDLSKLNLDDFIVPLSRLNRFSGNTDRPYSVARHCVLVSELCSFSKRISQLALLHDFHEAIIGDITRPVKNMFLQNGKFKNWDNDLKQAVYSKFMDGYEPSETELSFVKHYDDIALFLEGRRLHPNQEWVQTEFIRTIDLNLEDYDHHNDLFIINQRFEQLFGREHKWR